MPTATAAELNTIQIGKYKCGFCNTGSCGRCPGGTRSGTKGVRICPCEATERCGQKRCLKCNNRRTDEVADDWLCLSTTECEKRIQSRLDADPQHQNIVRIKEKTKMAEAAATKEKAAKVEKVGTCLVTGKPTKGGLFAPGQDAKYVSLRVADVEAAGFTKKAEDEQLKKMKTDGTSEKLQAKFTKAVGLAKARWEARKAAEKAKADDKAAKAAAAKDKTEA